MLGADVVVAEAQRLAQGELENLLSARREGDLPGGDLLARANDPHDLPADPLDRDVEALEDARGKALLLAEQAEQDVLGADVVVLERACLFLGKNDDLAGPLCESLKHRSLLPSPLLALRWSCRTTVGDRDDDAQGCSPSIRRAPPKLLSLP